MNDDLFLNAYEAVKASLAKAEKLHESIKKELTLKLEEVQHELSLPLNERGIIVLTFENPRDPQNCYLKGIEHALKFILKMFKEKNSNIEQEDED